jgi:hypothetical protein
VIEEIQRRVEEKMSKLLRIKKLKKKVIKLKKRCKKYKKLVLGLQDQLDAAALEVINMKSCPIDLFNMLELSIVNAGDVYSGVMHLHLKKKEMSTLKLTIDNPISIKMPTTENPLSLILQAETLAEYLGVKLKSGLLAATDIVGVTEKSVVDPSNPDKKVTVPVLSEKKVAEKEKKVETAKDTVQGSSPAVPVQKGSAQQNPK